MKATLPNQKGYIFHYIKKNNSLWLRKSWKIQSTSFSERQSLIKRLSLINDMGLLIKPKIKTFVSSDHCHIEQEFCKNIQKIDSNKKKKIIHELGDLIFLCHQRDLIHGDLCYSNIAISEKDELLVFDWEPFLEKHINGLIELRSSKYACHPIDMNSRVITWRSDLYAFINLTLQIVHGRYEGLKIAKKQSKRIEKLTEVKRHPLTILREINF